MSYRGTRDPEDEVKAVSKCVYIDIYSSTFFAGHAVAFIVVSLPNLQICYKVAHPSVLRNQVQKVKRNECCWMGKNTYDKSQVLEVPIELMTGIHH